MFDLSAILTTAGWLRVGAKLTKAAIKAYAEWHGIPPGPELEARVARHASLPRCGRPDVLSASSEAGGLCRWNKRSILVCRRFVVTGWTESATDAAWRAGWMLLASGCGLEIGFTDDARKADVVASYVRIDGAGSVLADSYLPCAGDDRQLSQRYDSGEPWASPQMGPAYFARVVAHEGSHALGLDHTSQPGNLMNPVIDPNRLNAGLGPWDSEQLMARYGPPISTPPTPASPTAVLGDWAMNAYDMAEGYKYRLVLVRDR